MPWRSVDEPVNDRAPITTKSLSRSTVPTPALATAPHRGRSRLLHAHCSLAFAALLGACATTAPSPSAPAAAPSLPAVGATPTAPPPTAAPDGKPAAKPGAPAPTPLATEQRFLEDWFRGTPVVIAAQGISTLQVEVPLVNSFDAGKADVKPALNAVLERVAESLRRQLGARVTVAAPADAGGAPALAAQRAQRVRDALVAKRIAAPRIVLANAPARAGGPLQLQLWLPAPPIARVDDSTLVAPHGGVKPVAVMRAPVTEKR
jgi:outer membrane protein OmpA-like peptidoglycan-associated protein